MNRRPEQVPVVANARDIKAWLELREWLEEDGHRLLLVNKSNVPSLKRHAYCVSLGPTIVTAPTLHEAANEALRRWKAENP